MGLYDRDYMRDPGPGGPRRPRERSGIGLDSGLLIGILLVGIGVAALIFKGFESDDDPYSDLDEFYLESGYPTVSFDINTASREDLMLIPMMSERIVDGIIERRDQEPFKLSEELLDVKGVGEMNLEILLMHLYGFEDAKEPRQPRRLPGIPDA